MQRPYTTQIQEMPFENRRHIVGSIMVGAGSVLLLACLFCHLLGSNNDIVKPLSFITFCVGLALLLTGLVFLCPRPGTITRMGEAYTITAQMGSTNSPHLIISSVPPPPVISGALPTTSDPVATQHIRRSSSHRHSSYRRTSSLSPKHYQHASPSRRASVPENRGVSKPDDSEDPPPYSYTDEIMRRNNAFSSWRLQTNYNDMKGDNV